MRFLLMQIEQLEVENAELGRELAETSRLLQEWRSAADSDALAGNDSGTKKGSLSS